MTFKILTVVATFFITLSAALAQSGDLVIFTTDGATLNVALDSKFQNKAPTTNLKITNIPEGDYWVTLLFHNKRKAVKSNVRILAGKENSFVVDKDGDSWKLKTYSAVPQSQVAASNSTQVRVAYDRQGVVVDGMGDAKELSESDVEQSPDYVRVHGTLDELKQEAEAKRRGQFSSTTGEEEEEMAAVIPNRTDEQGTTLVKRYVQTDNADGTTSIVEEATTTIKELIERDGQQQMRTKRSIAMTPTDYTCLPMEGAAFQAMVTRVTGLSKDQRLSAVQKEIRDACLTPAQIKNIGDLFKDKGELDLFVMAAQPTVADPNNFPYDIEDVAMVEQPIDELPMAVEEPVPSKQPVVAPVEKKEPVAAVAKTKAELRAELRATKARERAERKAAKQKAKAERKAAKAKVKAERAQ